MTVMTINLDIRILENFDKDLITVIMQATKLLFVSIFASFISCDRAHSALEFDADNYQDILSRTDNYSAVAFRTNDIREIDFVARNGKTLITQEDYIVKWTGNDVLNISSIRDGVHHTLQYKENSYSPYRYTVSHEDYIGSEAEQLGRHIFNKLISTGQFIIKESKLREGSDIIINEQEKYFIIGVVMGTKDKPLGVEFSCFEK